MGMRDGVILLFYDISVDSSAGRREYRDFVKKLKSEGYRPLQESVCYKYIRNVSMAKYEINRIRGIQITQGNVCCLTIGYGVFQSMVAVQGELPDFDAIRAPYIYL